MVAGRVRCQRRRMLWRQYKVFVRYGGRSGAGRGSDRCDERLIRDGLSRGRGRSGGPAEVLRSAGSWWRLVKLRARIFISIMQACRLS